MKNKDDLPWLREVCERRGIPIIREHVEETLVEILSELRPRNILEIGTAIGYSASVMATCLKDARITTVEKYDRSFYDAKEAFERLGVTEQIEQLMGDARDVMKDLITDGRCYDFIFIDAAKSHYREFFDNGLKLVRRGGIIMCDNMELSLSKDIEERKKRFDTSFKRMMEFMDYLQTLENVTTKCLASSDGISISYVE